LTLFSGSTGESETAGLLIQPTNTIYVRGCSFYTLSESYLECLARNRAARLVLRRAMAAAERGRQPLPRRFVCMRRGRWRRGRWRGARLGRDCGAGRAGSSRAPSNAPLARNTEFTTLQSSCTGAAGAGTGSIGRCQIALRCIIIFLFLFYFFASSRAAACSVF
jgi:hypothetical protein